MQFGQHIKVRTCSRNNFQILMFVLMSSAKAKYFQKLYRIITTSIDIGVLIQFIFFSEFSKENIKNLCMFFELDFNLLFANLGLVRLRPRWIYLCSPIHCFRSKYSCTLKWVKTLPFRQLSIFCLKLFPSRLHVSKWFYQNFGV